MIHCELVTPDSATDGLWTEWERATVQMPNGQRLFGPDWHRLWVETWGGCGQWTGQCQMIVARNAAGDLVGLLFLGRPKVGPVTVRAMGGHEVPHRGLLSVEGQETAVGSAIGKFIAQQSWPLLQLGPLRRSSVADAALIQSLHQSGRLMMHRREREEISLQVPESWDEYRQEVLGGKFFRKIGYYERRMERAGRVHIQHYRKPSADQTRTMIKDLQTIEAASWMAVREASVPRFANPELSKFWSVVTDQCLSSRDQIDCWVLSFHDTPVSFCFTLNDGETRYVIANQYDESVKDHRTGSTLYRYMIEDGIDRGIRRYEFGDGDLHYKSLWGAGVTDTSDTWFVVPNKLLSKIACHVPGLSSPPVVVPNDSTGGSPEEAPIAAVVTSGGDFQS